MYLSFFYPTPPRKEAFFTNVHMDSGRDNVGPPDRDEVEVAPLCGFGLMEVSCRMPFSSWSANHQSF